MKKSLLSRSWIDKRILCLPARMEIGLSALKRWNNLMGLFWRRYNYCFGLFCSRAILSRPFWQGYIMPVYLNGVPIFTHNFHLHKFVYVEESPLINPASISIKHASFSSVYTHNECLVIIQLLFQLNTHHFHQRMHIRNSSLSLFIAERNLCRSPIGLRITE